MKANLCEAGQIIKFFENGFHDGQEGHPPEDFDAPDMQGSRPTKYPRMAYKSGYDLGRMMRQGVPTEPHTGL